VLSILAKAISPQSSVRIQQAGERLLDTSQGPVLYIRLQHFRQTRSYRGI
jgi:hypothetical protein